MAKKTSGKKKVKVSDLRATQSVKGGVGVGPKVQAKV